MKSNACIKIKSCCFYLDSNLFKKIFLNDFLPNCVNEIAIIKLFRTCSGFTQYTHNVLVPGLSPGGPTKIEPTLNIENLNA